MRCTLLLSAAAVLALWVVPGCSAAITGTPVGSTDTMVTRTISTAPSAPTTTAAAPADGILGTTCEAFVDLSEQEQKRVSHDIAVALGRSDLANNVNFDLVARAGCLMHPTQLVKDTWAFD